MSYSIPLRGKLSGNPEISLAADMQIRVRDRFIEPLTLSRDDILGWSDPKVLDEAEERIWKRIPKLYRIRSSQLSGKLNLAILFREPVLLPPLKASAVKEMGLTHKQNRQGVWADGVVLQAEDPVEAGQLLGAWGVPSFDSGTEAFTALVGVEENPQAAERLQAERDATSQPGCRTEPRSLR